MATGYFKKLFALIILTADYDLKSPLKVICKNLHNKYEKIRSCRWVLSEKQLNVLLMSNHSARKASNGFRPAA